MVTGLGKGDDKQVALNRAVLVKTKEQLAAEKESEKKTAQA